MTTQRQFQRKVIYIVAIAALLFPLYILSQPATTKSEGGQLARLRKEYDLSQAELGKVDPTSASMKLATFGMQGIATNILWSRAINYKEREDFTNFDATLQQITYLQPHFVKVWEFQGHNMSFNVAVEFDDYRDRYHYVIKGFNLLKKGLRYNEKEPRLPRTLATYMGLKIGRSDEKKQFRVLFREDDDFHAPPRSENWLIGTRYEGRPENLRDSWLISKWWYRETEKLIDNKLAKYGNIYPVVFHSDAPRQQMQYAETLEKEGRFGAIAKQAWEEGGEEWYDYSLRLIPTTQGYSFRLIDEDKYRMRRDDILEQLNSIEPDLREKMRKKILANLTDEERAAWNKQPAERDPEEAEHSREIEYRLRIKPKDLAAAMSERNRAKGLQLADRYEYAEQRHRSIERGKDAVNFDYWTRRCEIEQAPQTIAAREAIYEAKSLYRDAKLLASRNKFEEAAASWKDVLERHPLMLEEDTFLEDLVKMIQEGYQEVLAQTSEDGSRALPEDYPLQFVVDMWEEKQKAHNAVAPAEDDSTD